MEDLLKQMQSLTISCGVCMMQKNVLFNFFSIFSALHALCSVSHSSLSLLKHNVVIDHLGCVLHSLCFLIETSHFNNAFYWYSLIHLRKS